MKQVHRTLANKKKMMWRPPEKNIAKCPQKSSNKKTSLRQVITFFKLEPEKKKKLQTALSCFWPSVAL